MKTKMKTSFYTTVLAIALSGIFSANAQSKNIAVTAIPAAAQTFVKQHFKGQTIDSAREEKEMFNIDYNVRLSDGVEIEFDDKGNWEEIDGNHKALPTSVIPKAITTYLGANYKGQDVIQIDKKRAGYDVELANGVELEFDTNGKFLRLDD